MKRIFSITALLLAPLAALQAAENATINLPAFRCHGVVLEAANLKYRPHDDIIYPSVVRVEGRIAKPLGKFYLYYAPHDAPGGICLAYADRPEGPWREYANNPVIARTWAPHYTVSHVSGPDVIWSEEEGRLFLYFHGENPQTRLATSADGIHFDYAAEVVNTRMFANLSEASYGRVFRHSLPGRDNRYVMLLMGNDRGTRRIYLAWSKDGRKWDTRPQPLMDPPAGTDQVAGAVLLSWGGKSYLIAHANNSKAAFNEGYDLYVAETDAALENVRPLGKFFERTLVSPTNPGVMSPCFIEDAGRLCMFFNIGARLRNKIALAIAEPVAPLAALHAADVPQSVAELWSDFDPRKDPLETKVIREWKEDGGVFRHVRYFIGTFKGKPARMAAIYGFPDGDRQNHEGQNHKDKKHDFAQNDFANKKKLPAVMHIHGGGQRASLSEVKMLVARGYAALSVNWGGSGNGKPPFNSVEGAQPGDPNTDWGAVDPTQLNVQGYSSMLPKPKQFFEDREHPKNCNWYLLTLGCRRGLTFLEQQPQVDAQRLGVHGYSMGGNLTMHVAGTDARVKAAVPGVGGQGWRWQPHEFIGGVAQQEHIKGDVEVFRRTLSFENYASLIRCPVLHRSASNDFHGWMDDVYRTDALITCQPVRHSWSVHFNHRLTPEVAVTMPLWFDHFLKGGPALPETPASKLALKTNDGVPCLRVTPKSTWPVARCEIHYSVDPDPRARFWRGADAVRDGDVFTAKLPLEMTDRPLFAFANVFYTLPKPVSLAELPGYGKEPIGEVCLSTALHVAKADALSAAGVRATEKPTLLVEDFAHGWRDWYRHNVGNRDHWQNWTRKITDPKWRGPDDAKLAVTLRITETNRMAFVVIENEWRNYRGPKKTFVCEKEIPGATDDQTVVLDAADFKSTEADGASLNSWSQLDVLGICAYHQEKGQPAKPPRWRGPTPEFKRLEWR